MPADISFEARVAIPTQVEIREEDERHPGSGGSLVIVAYSLTSLAAAKQLVDDLGDPIVAAAA